MINLIFGAPGISVSPISGDYFAGFWVNPADQCSFCPTLLFFFVPVCFGFIHVSDTDLLAYVEGKWEVPEYQTFYDYLCSMDWLKNT